MGRGAPSFYLPGGGNLLGMGGRAPSASELQRCCGPRQQKRREVGAALPHTGATPVFPFGHPKTRSTLGWAEGERWVSLGVTPQGSGEGNQHRWGYEKAA